MSESPSASFLDSGVVPRFAEPATFMRAPYTRSLEGVDIALAGVPYDLGCTNRNGPRQGPAQVREMSRLIRKINPYSGICPFDLANVADIGDAPVNPLDNNWSLDAITAFYAQLREKNIAVVSCGGDHTVTYPILRGLAPKNQPIGVIHFDAHSDTLDELYGSKINHGTVFRRGVEDGIIDPHRVIQIGLRGTRFSESDVQYAYDSGMAVVTMDDYERMGRDAVIKQMLETVAGGPVYITFDIDGLDPVYAIGTGAPEPGGLSMRDVQVIIRASQGLNIFGGDVCEVAPPLDPSGHTALNAANLMFEILCVTADARARSRAK
ncbi:MAG: agmatinase [Paraburkholderia sp.]|uniref:Agmatinase n=1 Tax=Paraburkholderia terricola TaxID=169427 RepID=A0A1M6T174_9BURK|nr:MULTISPECIES: agmatinase [Paraburkholderia]TAL95189.1 MAG: agmatinase [Paraburkholderia sp.]SDO71086.1 agmatinase [Paraburkholderia sediminicola]SHK50735.1 agmatinase [Paraburkholderia terricola]